MRGRRFLVTWCEGDTAEALKAAYQGERDLELRTRLHGLWLLRCGWRLLWVCACARADTVIDNRFYVFFFCSKEVAHLFF